MSTSCATRWPWIRWIPAASTSAPPAARSTCRPMPATTGSRSCAICRRCCRSRCRRCHDPRDASRTICARWPARGAEVQLDVAEPVTSAAVLDALEARYPMLRGTIRDHVTRAAPAVPALLRLPGRPVPRANRQPSASSHRQRRRTFLHHRRHRRRLTSKQHQAGRSGRPGGP